MLNSKILLKTEKLQDAYALCRVFKKSATGPKIGETYVTNSNSTNHHHHQQQQLHSDRSSSIELYSDGRCDDFESSNYQMQLDTCSPSMLTRSSSPLDHMINNRRDVRWSHSHFPCEDPFNFTNPSFSNCGNISCNPPSKVLNV